MVWGGGSRGGGVVGFHRRWFHYITRWNVCIIEKGVLTVKGTIENINKENLSVYVVCVVYGVATAGNS